MSQTLGPHTSVSNAVAMAHELILFHFSHFFPIVVIIAVFPRTLGSPFRRRRQGSVPAVIPADRATNGPAVALVVVPGVAPSEPVVLPQSAGAPGPPRRRLRRRHFRLLGPSFHRPRLRGADDTRAQPDPSFTGGVLAGSRAR